MITPLENLRQLLHDAEAEVGRIKQAIEAVEVAEFRANIQQMRLDAPRARVVWQGGNGEVKCGDWHSIEQAMDILEDWLLDGARERHGLKVEFQDKKAHLPCWKYSGLQPVTMDVFLEPAPEIVE